MKGIRHIIIHSLLIFGLLPLQNSWAMADMASCDIDMSSHDMSSHDMSSHDMSNMSMSDCSANMDTSSTSNSLDCDDNHCNKCFHGTSAILTNDTAVNNDKVHQRFVLLNSRYLSVTTPLDLPPPIIS